jgi:two-component sensor histidine kinase
MNINEVLNKSHPIEKWIKDFVDSDNPKFSGKSKEERIKMAKGAYYSAQKEDISIDEETKKEDLPFDPDPPKKNPSAKAGKYGLGHSVAKHLARQALKKQQGVKEETEEQKKEKEALDLKLAKAKNSQRAAKALGEEVEELDELDKKTLGSYVNKAHNQLMKHTSTTATKFARGDKDATAYALDKDALRKTANRTQGMKTAISKLTKEENLDEISKDTLNSYVHKAFQQGNDLHYDIAHERDKSEKEKMKAKLSKRNSGVIRAAKKLREGISMLSFDDYLKEALHPNQVKLDKNKNGKLDAHDFKKLRKEDQTEEGFVSHAQRKAVWASKNEKGVKEEIELDEAAWGKDKMTNLRQAHDRHMEKALAANKAGDDEATKVHQRKMQMIQSKMQKLKQNEEVEQIDELSRDLVNRVAKARSTNLKSALDDSDKRQSPISQAQSDKKANDMVKKYQDSKAVQKIRSKQYDEEVEELDEISKKTATNAYAARVARVNNAGDDNKMEKHADKAYKTAKHIGARYGSTGLNKAYHKAGEFDLPPGHYNSAVRDTHAIMKKRMTKEEVEELDELSKSTLGSYVKKASKDSRNKALDVGSEMTSTSDASVQSAIKKFNKSAKRVKGISTAVDKLTKEETENMKSYKDFMTALQEELDIIDEAKIDDLKDRIAAKKATQSAYDKDYKPSVKSNVMKVKGHSYGAGSDDEGDDDEGTQKVSKPTASVVKRGRGRPSGSKSGARN